MSKKLLFGSESTNKLLRGVSQLVEAVASTLGPQGRTVIIERPFQPPHVTKDGVTVAKEVILTDPVENMGCDLVKQAALSTANTCGDGTTTSTVIAGTLLDLLSNLEEHNNLNKVIKGTKEGLRQAVAYITKVAEPIDIDSPRLEQVATISANNDSELGGIIADAIRKVGDKGVVTIQESKNFQTTLDISKGITFDKGYLSSHFVTDPQKMTVEYEEPLILFVDESIRDIQRLAPIIEAALIPAVNKPLIIIADDIIEQALNVMTMNKMNKGVRIVAIKAPSFGDARKEMMRDLAVSTGGTYISDSQGLNLDTLGRLQPGEILNRLGQADKIIVKKNQTIIVGGKGEQEDIDLRIGEIEAQLEGSLPEQKYSMKNRIAKLAGAVAVISVGGQTDVEMKERKDRADDALSATLSALEEGIVDGGGWTLYSTADSIVETSLDPDVVLGINALAESLRSPYYRILANAGIELEEGPYDALNDTKVKSLKTVGIIDPAKVTRVALENAVSVACTIFSTQVTISMEPLDKPKEISSPW